MGSFDEGVHVPAWIVASTIGKGPIGVVLRDPIGGARLRNRLGKARAHRWPISREAARPAFDFE